MPAYRNSYRFCRRTPQNEVRFKEYIRLSLTQIRNAVVQDLLPVIDAFDAAASQVKADTDGEKKIAASYQVC